MPAYAVYSNGRTHLWIRLIISLVEVQASPAKTWGQKEVLFAEPAVTAESASV
jgi:hypothetical protein